MPIICAKIIQNHASASHLICICLDFYLNKIELNWGHMLPSSTVDFGWFVAFESIKIFSIKIDRNCNFVGLLHHPFWL